jgi:hypothetical protein
MNDKVKNILVDVVIVFVIPFGIFYFYQTLMPSEGGGSEQPGSELAGEGQKFLVKLNDLNALKLDTSVFESAVYRSLIDTTVPPPTEAKGRPHPFIPPYTPAPPPSTPTTPTKGKSTTAIKNLNTLVGGQ